jgi:hypothetical protein
MKLIKTGRTLATTDQDQDQDQAGKKLTSIRWTGEEITLSQQNKDFINQLFMQLKIIFPAWRNAFKSTDELNRAKRGWAAALIRHGRTSPKMIKRALTRCELSDSPFFPSIGQFIAWSRPGANERDLRVFDPYGNMIIDEDGKRCHE